MTNTSMHFAITPEQEMMFRRLQELFAAASAEEAVLCSSRAMLYLAEALAQGQDLYLGEPPSNLVRLALPELAQREAQWQWLTARDHPWRRQLWVKGRRLLASQVWRDMLANGMSEEAAADNWDLPLEAIREICAYCTEHAALIAAEASEEQQRLRLPGAAFETAA
jgi:uncharacterized protein (DUF433 family)